MRSYEIGDQSEKYSVIHRNALSLLGLESSHCRVDSLALGRVGLASLESVLLGLLILPKWVKGNRETNTTWLSSRWPPSASC